MQYRTPLAAIALAVLLATAGCLGSITGAVDGTDEQPVTDVQSVTQHGDAVNRTVEVAATGQASAAPDQAVLRVAVVATGPDAATARQRLAENASRMREALHDTGVEDGQIATLRYDIDRDYRRDESEEVRYRAYHAYRITVTDLEATGTVIDTAVENGASQVDDVRYTLSSERRRDLRTEAIADAMANANGQATALAEGADLAIDGVTRVRTGDTGYRPYGGVEMAAADTSGDTDIEGGPVTVSVRVEVVYAATEN